MAARANGSAGVDRRPRIRIELPEYRYAPEGPPILGAMDIEIRPGEIFAIVGPSGCGKSTVLNLIAGLLTPAEGTIRILSPDQRAPRVGYMFARDSLLLWRRAIHNVELAMEVATPFGRAERHRRAEALLAEVGLDRFATYWPTQLSQGMRQRVALARTYSTEPDLLLMDEPFAALDVQMKLQMQDLFLRTWERHPATVVWVTHDLGEAVLLADRVCVMSPGPGRVRVIEPVTLPRPRLASQVLFDPHTQALQRQLWALMTGDQADGPPPGPGGAPPEPGGAPPLGADAAAPGSG